jgi:hypothetical protein
VSTLPSATKLASPAHPSMTSSRPLTFRPYDMFAHINDWSTLDGMFPAQDQILKELDDLLGPIDEAMGINRPRRTSKKQPR